MKSTAQAIDRFRVLGLLSRDGSFESLYRLFDILLQKRETQSKLGLLRVWRENYSTACQLLSCVEIARTKSKESETDKRCAAVIVQ